MQEFQGFQDVGAHQIGDAFAVAEVLRAAVGAQHEEAGGVHFLVPLDLHRPHAGPDLRPQQAVIAPTCKTRSEYQTF